MSSDGEHTGHEQRPSGEWEIFDECGDVLCILPAGSEPTARDHAVALAAYRAGRANGEVAGRILLQGELRNLLGAPSLAVYNELDAIRRSCGGEG